MAQQISSPAACNWHALSIADVTARLNTDLMAGLHGGEAAKRLISCGPNRLADPPKTTAWVVFTRQFAGVLPMILGGASVLALAIGEVIDAIAILVVLAINGVFGFFQERRAEQALTALKTMLAQRAAVRRNGTEQQIAASDLVPGDVVLLATGDRVPADGRLIDVHALEIDESVLTGESMAVPKQTGALSEDAPPIGDRSNMAYTNTVVTRGRGEMLVTATGMTTETGRLAEMLSVAEESATPLQNQLDRLGKRLAAMAVTVVGVILVIALLQGTPLTDAVLTAITLAVAAVPEGLPAVVTVTLALGMQRMARRGAIVKRLAAVETLGCASVVCSDKTGTLTLNRMTARTLIHEGRSHDLSQSDTALDVGDLTRLLLPMALCNDSRLEDGKVIGDPTEGALLSVCSLGGIYPAPLAEQMPRIAEVPFDSTRKFMATMHDGGERVHIFVKGAPDVLMGRCTRIAGPGGDMPFDDTARAEFLKHNDALAAEALRVIAVASRDIPLDGFDQEANPEGLIQDLVLLGLVGMADPIRPEVKAAVARCRDAGIRVKMVTGDHKATAAAIAGQLGLDGDVVLGADLDAMDTATLSSRIEDIDVFARVAPENKMRIIEALKAQGHIVAMTGDGVNDAPALKHADIGMAMGRAGTEVTKEAATLVLTDDNFATIVRAIEEGRTIYANIVKFVRYQLSTNLGALLAVFTATVMGLPMPFSPIQLLWVNVIMDGPPAMALGVDPIPEGQMNEKPRSPDDEILTLNRFWGLLYLGIIMAVGTLGVFLWALETGTEARAVTLAFTTFVMFQVANAFNARDERRSAFTTRSLRNRALWGALLTVVCLQVTAVNWPPAQIVMHTASLSVTDWALAVAVAASIVVLEESRKLVVRKSRRAPSRD